MREEKIRHDIVQAATNSLNLDQSVVIFGKAKLLNKLIDKQIGIDLISIYKRAFNILNNEKKDQKLKLSNTTTGGSPVNPIFICDEYAFKFSVLIFQVPVLISSVAII